jgi:hypothetical protein
MTSRFGQRAVGVAAIVAIILLTVLIILLWTAVGEGVFNSKNAAPDRPQAGYELRTHDSESRRNENDATTIFRGRSTADEGPGVVTPTPTLPNEGIDDSSKSIGEFFI